MKDEAVSAQEDSMRNKVSRGERDKEDEDKEGTRVMKVGSEDKKSH